MPVVGTVYLNGCNYQVGYDLLSQSQANNTSRVRFYGTLNVTNLDISWTRGSASVWTTSTGIATRYTRGSYRLVAQEVTVTHDANGYYSNVTLSGSLSTTYVSGTASGKFSLPRILRNATITSAPNFTDEANPTINYNNPLGNNATSLKACISLTGATDNIAYRDIPKTSGTYTFTLTEAERDVLRAATIDSNQRIVKFFVRTEIGSSVLHNSVDRNLTIVNANPTFNNFNFEDINEKTIALTGDNQSVISGYSNVKVTIPINDIAIAKKKATMSKYRVTIGENNSQDITYSSNTDVTTTINNVTSGVINTYAIDSRGNSTMVTKQASNIVQYTPLIKGTITVNRNNGGVGEQVTLQYNGTIDKVNFGSKINSITKAEYTIQRTDSSTITPGVGSIVPSITDNTFSFDGFIGGDNEELGFDIDVSYIITVTVYDELSSVQFVATLSSGIPGIALHKNGVGIMGRYDVDEGGLLQIRSKSLENILKPVILYDNSNGTNVNFTLSDEIKNYEYIEIFSDEVSQKVITKGLNNKRATIISVSQDGNVLIWCMKVLTFIGKNVSVAHNGRTYTYPNTYTNNDTANVINIYRVIGYKYEI